jgi:PAS domain S-box-containing protein
MDGSQLGRCALLHRGDSPASCKFLYELSFRNFPHAQNRLLTDGLHLNPILPPRPPQTPLDRAENLIAGQQLLLTNAAGAASADEALTLIATFVEGQAQGVRCCVFRMEEWGSALWLAAAPSMSAVCADALAMIPVGAVSEASGTAAHLRQTVIVEDVASSPLFDGWREVMGSGLNSCMAAPIFGPEQEVLGTVAIYSPTRGKPETHELGLLAFAGSVAAVVITRFEAVSRCRKSEARSRALLQHAADVVLLADVGGTIRFISTATHPFPGGGSEGLIGRSVWSFVDQGQREWVKSVFRAATKRNDVATQAFRVVREDGEVRWLEVTISNQLKHPGLEAMVLNYRDITDRVTALDRLWQQEEQYRAIVEAVTDGILILDRSGAIVTANTAACEMHGYTLDELIGRPAADLFQESDRPKLAEFVESTAGSLYAEAGGLCKDGRALQVILRGTSFPIWGIPHLLAVVSNVSEHKRMQQRLELSR